MDTSETYVKMADYPKIQERWEPAEGDCCVERAHSSIILHLLTDLRGYGFITEHCWGDDEFLDEEQSVWLPYQHQLQEMLGFCKFFTGNPTLQIGAVYHRTSGEGDPDGYYFFNFSSMEQLWLAFVMKELHGKTWDGSEWHD